MHEKWKKHLPYLLEHVKSKSPAEMATELKVSEKDLKLFLHRYRLFDINLNKNLALRIITAKFTYPEYFEPTKQFFECTGIGQRRWWLLYKGKKEMTGKEFHAVVTHLKVSDKEVFAGLQLDLFEDGIL